MDTQSNPVLSIGIGAIGPKGRLQNNEINQATLDEVARRLNADDFYTTTDIAIPTQCVDGRPRADGTCDPAPNAAAGTFTAVIADALTTGRYLANEHKATTHAKAVYTFLKLGGYTIGGHDADHIQGDGCGCGAEDKLPDILAYIRDRGQDVRTVVEGLEIVVDGQTHQLIINNAAKLLDESYASAGKDLRQTYIDVAGDKCVETLTGPHNEVVLVINTQPETTLDRSKLAAAFGTAYQAFNVDVPAVQKVTQVTSVTEPEAMQKFVAALYYNVATAAVLANDSLRIVVR